MKKKSGIFFMISHCNLLITMQGEMLTQGCTARANCDSVRYRNQITYAENNLWANENQFPSLNNKYVIQNRVTQLLDC